MDRLVILLLCVASCSSMKFCDGIYKPLEVGQWKPNLKHLDSGVVENKPVTIKEGQVYVYENDFPGYTIKYIHVDNLAMRTCGASAEVKSGGIGQSTVLIIIHAEANNEIRSVVDIWGVKNLGKATSRPVTLPEYLVKNMRSLYVSKDFRTVNHNMNTMFHT